jgi:hypothetical protein
MCVRVCVCVYGAAFILECLETCMDLSTLGSIVVPIYIQVLNIYLYISTSLYVRGMVYGGIYIHNSMNA